MVCGVCRWPIASDEGFGRAASLESRHPWGLEVTARVGSNCSQPRARRVAAFAVSSRNVSAKRVLTRLPPGQMVDAPPSTTSGEPVQATASPRRAVQPTWKTAAAVAAGLLRAPPHRTPEMVVADEVRPDHDRLMRRVRSEQLSHRPSD
jgi:hypothetical protein